MAEKRWTVCMMAVGKLRKVCQYSDKEKAEAHATSIGGVVKLFPANPERMAKVGGRRSCESFHKVGLPQY